MTQATQPLLPLVRQALDAMADRHPVNMPVVPGQLLVLLQTSDDRAGADIYNGKAWLGCEWDDDEGDGETVSAALAYIPADPAKEAKFIEITGDAWRELESNASWIEFYDDVKSSGLEMAIRAVVDVYENSYEHEGCNAKWNDTHSCGCDDECPVCGTSVSPTESRCIQRLGDGVPADLEVHSA